MSVAPRRSASASVLPLVNSSACKVVAVVGRVVTTCSRLGRPRAVVSGSAATRDARTEPFWAPPFGKFRRNQTGREPPGRNGDGAQLIRRTPAERLKFRPFPTVLRLVRHDPRRIAGKIHHRLGCADASIDKQPGRVFRARYRSLRRWRLVVRRIIDSVNCQRVLALFQPRLEIDEAGLGVIIARAGLMAVDEEFKGIVAHDQRQCFGRNRWQLNTLAQINVSRPGLVGGLGIVPDPFGRFLRAEPAIGRFTQANVRVGIRVTHAGQRRQRVAEFLRR